MTSLFNGEAYSFTKKLYRWTRSEGIFMDNLSPTQRANVEFHKRLAPQYERQPFFQESNQRRVRAILKDLSQRTDANRLLDVGCGTGLVLDLAHDLFQELDGIDITKEMLEKVTTRTNVRVQLANATAIPFPDKTFDAVTAYSVLHHIEDLDRIFKEIRRVLKPGGFLYADESPSQDYLKALVSLEPSATTGDAVLRERERITSDVKKYETKYGIPGEVVRNAMTQNYALHSLTEENLDHLLKSNGFERVQITFRRFLGEDQARERGGEEMVHTIGSYLASMLPLTRHLFKYFVLVAQ